MHHRRPTPRRITSERDHPPTHGHQWRGHKSTRVFIIGRPSRKMWGKYREVTNILRRVVGGVCECSLFHPPTPTTHHTNQSIQTCEQVSKLIWHPTNLSNHTPIHPATQAIYPVTQWNQPNTPNAIQSRKETRQDGRWSDTRPMEPIHPANGTYPPHRPINPSIQPHTETIHPPTQWNHPPDSLTHGRQWRGHKSTGVFIIGRPSRKVWGKHREVSNILRPFTQRDRPYTQRDRPYTQRDRPYTQRDRPYTQRDHPSHTTRPSIHTTRPSITHNETVHSRNETVHHTQRDHPYTQRDHPSHTMKPSNTSTKSIQTGKMEVDQPPDQSIQPHRPSIH